MIGALLLLTFISAFNSETDPDAWLNVYWFLWLESTASFAFYFSPSSKYRNSEWI
jgi:hypothetical protein